MACALMACALLDTLKFAKPLEAAGIRLMQAEAIVEVKKQALNEASSMGLATKHGVPFYLP